MCDFGLKIIEMNIRKLRKWKKKFINPEKALLKMVG